MFCAIFSNCRWGHLKERQIQKSFMQRSFRYKVGMIPLNFFQFHNFLFLVMDAILTGHYYLILKRTQCKNRFHTNLVKLHAVVIEIFSFSCFELLLVTADYGHRGMKNCKKSKRLHTRNILAQSWINFNRSS